MWEEPLSSTRWTSNSAGTLASRSSRKSMKLAAVLRSRSVAVKIPPPWTSRAASKIAVPGRTYSCSWRAGRPGPTGVVGRVRLRAPIPVFSSTDSTSALVGGTMDSPQMSAARSQKPGSSGRVIQLRTRWGLMSRSARIRPIWEAEIPMSANSLASWEWLQLLGRGGGWWGAGAHDRQPLMVFIDQRATRPLAVLEAGQAFGLKAAPPLGHGVLVHA